MEDSEIWRDVVGYEDRFQVSSKGRLYSKLTNKLLSQTILKSGYYSHSTKIGGRKGKAVCLKIHRLVAEAFIINPENKPYVNHIDGNKLNNCIDNLEWVTAKENINHAIENGLMTFKISLSDIIPSKVSMEDVDFIVSNYKPFCRINGMRSLSLKYNICRRTLKKILDAYST